MTEVKVSCPATIANIVCGFDILGLAVNDPCEYVTIKHAVNPGISIKHLDSFGLPTDPEKNVAAVALQSMLDELEIKTGFELIIEKKINPGSGLGSSAASAAGAVVAANVLLGNIFSKKDLVRFAMHGEALASGAKHADNIAPCIYGGVTLIRDTASFDIIQLATVPLFISIIHPQIEVKTSEARMILPKEIPLKKAIIQWGNIAGLVAGFMQNDLDLIGRSMEDVIIEPVRSGLIPGFEKVKKRCKEAGALAGGISGSGPSIFMFSKDEATAKIIKDIMCKVYEDMGIAYADYLTTINNDGVKIVDIK